MYVLTSSPYVCNLFTKQKSELNFDSNEDFILFLLTNTCKLASFANQLNPVLNKLLEYTITDVTCTESPPKTPTDCSQSPTRYKHPASPQQPAASAADIQQILDTVNQNKRIPSDSSETNLEEADKTVHESETEKSDTQQKEDNEPNDEKRQRFHSDSTISETEAMDSSSDSDDLGEPPVVPYQSTSESNTTSKEEQARSSHHRHEPSPRRVSSDAAPSSTNYRPARSPESKDQEEEDRMLFDPADLMQKSTAALQVSNEVMKPHSSLKPPPPPTTHPADTPPEVRPATQTQRLVLPRQSSPFKGGHLIAVPVAIGNEMKGIPLPPIHSASHSGPGYTTTISQPSRPPPVSTPTPKPPHKDTEQNRENLNVTNEMDTENSDKMYICPICNKEFKGSGRVRNCKIHINTVHLKHKPYKCNFCNVRFGYKDYMKRHLIRHHKSLFYSYGTESVLEKYTTYDLEDPSQQEHEGRHEGRDQRDTAGL
ncbi:hypothetical protein ACHWQZ_G017422 [Mnemiopsis leidyi]